MSGDVESLLRTDQRASVDELAARLELLEEMARRCRLCPRECGVDRIAGERGWCGLGWDVRVDDKGPLWAEELPFSPSYELFFRGCNMGCVFCYRHGENLEVDRVEAIDAAGLADAFARAEPAGAASLHLVGGEPALYLPAIIAALMISRPSPPVLLNTGCYLSPSITRLIPGAVDLVIANIHFGNDQCAARMASAPDYLGQALPAVDWLAPRMPLIVRHLVLPGHLDCCLAPTLNWLADNHPDLPFTLLTNYLPSGLPESKRLGIDRYLTEEENERSRQMVETSGLRPVAGALARRGAHRQTPFETELIIEPDGRVVIKQLDRGMLEIARSLSPDDPRLTERETDPEGG